MSQFWKALNGLCGVKLKMLTAYHPQTDGTSEQMNKTINQALCFHVDHQQRGWVCALPQIQFAIMNTVNASTGFSNFQLHLGRSPCVIPPLVPERLPLELWSALTQVEEVIVKVNLDIGEAGDNLLAAKVDQAHYANTNHGLEVIYNVGDCIMLSTSHRHNEYRKRGDKQAAKIFLWWDGPYTVT